MKTSFGWLFGAREVCAKPRPASARELLFRLHPEGGVELTLRLDRSPSPDSLRWLATRTDLARTIELAAASDG
jgi:hypothetical protein